MQKVIASVLVVLLIAAMSFAVVRNPPTSNKIMGSISVEAGKSITKTIYAWDANGIYSTNVIKIGLYSESLTGMVSIGPTAVTTVHPVDSNHPESADPNTLWVKADVTISPSDLDVGSQSIFMVVEDQQNEPNLLLRNQDYQKIAVEVTKRIDISPPCFSPF